VDRLVLSTAAGVRPSTGSRVGLTIGLTGGIGSGKSTVAAALVDCGAWLVDTDAIARRLTGPGGAALPAVLQAFGPQALAADGSLDRVAMRERVFNDSGAKARLESILHPLIGEQALHEAATATNGQPVVFDVPLLAESRHWRARVQRVLVVDCSEATQVQRVAQRPGWSEDMARSVVAQQAPRMLRRSIADAVIHNDGISLQALQAQVRALWRCWAVEESPPESTP
jgi:dephospho-CoA kinase